MKEPKQKETQGTTTSASKRRLRLSKEDEARIGRLADKIFYVLSPAVRWHFLHSLGMGSVACTERKGIKAIKRGTPVAYLFLDERFIALLQTWAVEFLEEAAKMTGSVPRLYTWQEEPYEEFLYKLSTQGLNRRVRWDLIPFDVIREMFPPNAWPLHVANGMAPLLVEAKKKQEANRARTAKKHSSPEESSSLSE